MRWTSLLLVLATIGLSGCVLDTLADCRNLCERYADCFDPSTDIDACTTRCESRVNSGENDRADRCDSCLDEHDTCVGATLACATHCAPLLAP
ncbi:MAG TPA: hypothetical protein VIL20_00905 [Sandaracinaceae bacterium]